MVLKDIKNEPNVNDGLKRPLSSLKRRMSESGCPSSPPSKSRFRKGDVEQNLDSASTGSRSEQNLNICTDLTNTPLALQGKDRIETLFGKRELSGPRGLMNYDGVVSPVLSKENVLLSSPDSYSSSSVFCVSNTSLSYFADPTVPNANEEQNPTESSSINSDKYFSTPMPSRDRMKKKLTPVMEVNIESNLSDEWHPQDKLSSIDLLHNKPYSTDVLSHESPTKTPLYRSFFAAECQEIVNQIENRETLVRTPGKRNVEAFDVSTIDAEPPPYDCTPMKSLLACEVATIIRSLESSPVEGLSMFGESLLDLEKTDMQLNDFNLSECQTLNNPGCSASNIKGLSVLSDGLNGVCAKRQKTEPLEISDCKANKDIKILLPLHVSPASKCSVKRITQVSSNNLLHTEQQPLDNVMTPDMAATQVSKVLKTSPQILVTTTKSPVHAGPSPTCLEQMGKVDEDNLCASTVQDIEVTYDELPPTDITHVIEKGKASTDTRPSITSMHEITVANATIVTEILPSTSNTTQDIPFIQEEVNLANTTQVIEMVGLLSANMTQDIASVHDSVTSANSTQEIDAVPLSANTTHEITSVADGVTTANTIQIIEVAPQVLVNTTQDIPPTHESKTANITHEIELVPQSCVNATQDVASLCEAAEPATITQVIEMLSEASAKRAAGTTSICNSIPTCHTQHSKTMPKSSADIATPNPCTETNPKAPCHAKESCEQVTDNHGKLFKKVSQPSLNIILDAPAQLSDLSLTGATGSNAAVPIPSSSLNADNKCLMLNDCRNVSKLDPKQQALVVNDGNELQSVASEAQTSVICVTIDPSTQVSPPVQPNHHSMEGQKLEGSEKSCPGMTTSQTDVICKESGNQPLLSESCCMIQEEENAHDISVFSIGSLSFVTSTPVPGITNFQYQKPVMDSVQQDPSIGSVQDEIVNKVLGKQQMNTPHDAQGLNCKAKGNVETSPGSSLPLRMQRGMVPPTEAIPKPMKSSGIPLARRSLALYQSASQNTARDPAVSKIAQGGGIPGRGIIRPPMARQSLPRASLGNLKQTMEAIGKTSLSKPTGSLFKNPKATALKVKLATTHSQLSSAPPPVRPPSRLGVPSSTRQLSFGGQNALLHDAPSDKSVSSVRPPTSTGIGTGLPRPGTSSICPSLSVSQKLSPKPQVQGLAMKKSQRERSTLGSRRQTGSKAESTSTVRSSAKQPPLTQGSATEASSPASFSLNHTVQTKADIHEKEQRSRSSKVDIKDVPTISTELADSGLDRCQHLEICKCCDIRYRQILQENEDLKKRLDII
ncbi:uncharacterized protein ACNLHF_001331 isoform 2-T5 [Anomaloglossus baeobatrachus]|uniref:uncharacterized protein LOC142251310 isoform X2 n=1 Tax=Anomaloglossus baeobatrachus TaxID=238106 RepID=UPI003F4FF0D5